MGLLENSFFLLLILGSHPNLGLKCWFKFVLLLFFTPLHSQLIYQTLLQMFNFVLYDVYKTANIWLWHQGKFLCRHSEMEDISWIQNSSRFKKKISHTNGDTCSQGFVIDCTSVDLNPMCRQRPTHVAYHFNNLLPRKSK